jgi:hypothetical protein
MGYVKYPDKAKVSKSKGKSWLGYPYPNTIITAMLMGFKIGGVLHYPWWLVASPMWIPLAFIMASGVLFGVVVSLILTVRYIIKEAV